METFGKKISKYRKANGLTQAELGEELNVTSQAVSKWEKDLSEPDIETLKKMCVIFDISLDEFVGSDKKAKDEELAETAIAEAIEKIPPKVIVGYCKTCSKPIYQGEKYEVLPETVSSIICANCSRRKKIDNKYQEIGDLQDSKKKGLGWGIFGGIVALIISLVAMLMNHLPIALAIIVPIVIGYAIFAFISQLFVDGVVWEIFEFFFRSFNMPGVIFTLDLDGIISLIFIKLAFGALSWLLSALIFCLGVVIASFCAIFTYPFSITTLNRNISSKAIEIDFLEKQKI